MDIGLYQSLGGKETCRKLSEVFYGRVARDPVLRPFFPGKSQRCAIEAFTAFLVQFLGGPAEDTQKRWWVSLHESHLRFQIGPKERDAWMKNMVAALEDLEIDEPSRTALRGLFEQSSAYLVNTGQAPAVNGHMQGEVAQRWDAQLRMDEVVAAVRRGDPECAIALAGAACSPALLGVMIGSEDPTLLEFVRERLLAQPALAQERYSGRTLMHAAAAAGSLGILELLLQLGAAPNVLDDGGHTPLYCLANEYRGDGGAVVRALIQAGAEVDACEGVKRCTALHMAARRGNVEIAEALLDCGADMERKDSLGDTPLRRAVNCGQAEFAKMLLSRGADRYSVGSKGLTPLSAARTAAMKKLVTPLESRL